MTIKTLSGVEYNVDNFAQTFTEPTIASDGVVYEKYVAFVLDGVAEAKNAAGGTSTTSNTIGTGSKTFTVAPASHGFTVGMEVYAASTASPTNKMSGTVTAVSGASVTISSTVFTGSGTFTAWTLGVTGMRGAAGTLNNVSDDTSPELGGNLDGANYMVSNLKIGAGVTTPFTTVSPVAGVVTLDLSTSSNFLVSLTGNVTSFTITNWKASVDHWVHVRFQQDGTGGRTVAWTLTGGTFSFGDAGAITVTAAAGKEDRVMFVSNNSGTKVSVIVAGQNF